MPFALFVALAGSAAAQPAPRRRIGGTDAKSCEHARKKIAREQRTAAEVADTLAKARRARETCVSRSACARYDEAIRDTERRQARQATRLAPLRAGSRGRVRPLTQLSMIAATSSPTIASATSTRYTNAMIDERSRPAHQRPP